MKRNFLMTISIPIICVVGVVAFFVLFPSGSMTLMNFIDYAASLSTVVMVLVYVFTTSRQLNAMRSQLEEMRATRNLQTQPLLFLTLIKAYLEAPRFWTSPPNWKMDVGYRIFIELSAQNVGIGPLVTANFDPILLFERKSGFVKIDTRGPEIDSLKESAKKKIKLMFSDEGATMINNALYDEPFTASMRLVILFKNVLGGCFKSKVAYLLTFSDANKEKLKACLKTLKTAEIDYAKEIELHDALIKEGKETEASGILDRVNNEFLQKTGCGDIPFEVILWEGSFSIMPLTEQDYKKEVALRIPVASGCEHGKALSDYENY